MAGAAKDTGSGGETASDLTLRNHLGYALKRTFLVIQADVARTLDPFELRMITYSALAVIGDNPGLSQSQLAAALAIERPNLVVIVDELERKELITRDRVPTDRRAYALNLTRAGKSMLADATQALNAHEARMMADITPEEKALMFDILKRIERSDSGRS